MKQKCTKYHFLKNKVDYKKYVIYYYTKLLIINYIFNNSKLEIFYSILLPIFFTCFNKNKINKTEKCL